MSNEKQTADWEELMALMDGELPRERAEYLKKHLEECEECRSKVMDVENASGTLRRWDVPELSAGKANATLKLIQEGGTTSSGNSSLLRRFRTPILALGGLTAVALFMILPVRHVQYRDAALRQNRPQVYEAPASDTPLAALGGDDRLTAEAWNFPQQSKPKRSPMPLQNENTEISKFRTDLSAAKQRAATESAPMIARSVALSIVVKDCIATRTALEAILVRHQGYAASLTVNSAQNNARSIDASLRIPGGELTAAIAELRALGIAENETQKGEEVSQQHSDLIARLKNSRDTEQRLQAILIQRTGKISDVLEVEQEIARVRGEIEEMEAQQKALEHRVDFATVDLQLREEYHAQLTTPSLSNRIRNATVSGFQSAEDAVVGMLLFFLDYGPSFLLWLAILFLPGRKIWRWLRAGAIKQSAQA